MNSRKTKTVIMLGLGLGLAPMQSALAGGNDPAQPKVAIQRLVTAGEIMVTPNGELLVSPLAYKTLNEVAPVPQDQLLKYLEEQMQSEPKLIEASLRGTIL